MFRMSKVSTQPDSATLCEWLHAARTRTLGYAGRLRPDQWLGPQLKIVNPPLWEIGHVGWFHEHWCLRYQADGTLVPSIMPESDALYNSATVPHEQRWNLPLPTVEQTLQYLRDVLNAIISRLAREGTTEHLHYFVQLAVFHEEMHNEAFAYTCQTLNYPFEKYQEKQILVSKSTSGDADIDGGPFLLGAHAGDSFVFDNEKWAHQVTVRPFRMARTAVSNAEFAAFVDDGGYAQREWWRDEGWHWREEARAMAPLYWKQLDGEWFRRRHGQWVGLEPSAAVIHVNWYEADAWCRWARRRLPSEAEWEFAAATAPGNTVSKRRYPWGDALPAPGHANLYGVMPDTVDVSAFPGGDSAWGVRQMFGNVWEWTADWFRPYPGFVCDPYREYSKPWFGNHKVLRGGGYATRACLLRNTWRNFYTPDRRDVLAGFRTCALD